MVARSPAELCSPISTWRHTRALSLNSTEKKKKTSQVGLLPLAAEIALVLVPGIIHTLLTRVFRLWVVLVLRYSSAMHWEPSAPSWTRIHLESSFQRQAI